MIMDSMKNLNLNIDAEFWQDFVQESCEHVEDVEMNVLKLEQEPENTEIINSMFRAFHTIKGLSGFVEHVVIQELAHKTETLMDYCRKGETKVDNNIIETILKSADYIKHLSADVDAWKDEALIENISAHLAHLDKSAADIENKLNGTGTSAPQETVQEETLKEEAPFEEVIIDTSDTVAEIIAEAATASQDEEIIIPIEREVDAEGFLNEDFSSIIKEESSEENKKEENALEEHLKEEAEKEKKSKDKKEEVLPKAQETLKQQAEPAKPLQQPAATSPIESTAAKQKSGNEEFMRVSNARMDHLVDTIGELIISQSLIKDYVTSNYSQDNQFVKNLDTLTRVTRELQDISTFLRSVSLKSTFQKISRIARDTITELKKDIEFVTSGETTEIDRVVADKLLEPLVHLIKNAISHGIEPDSQDRVKHGKRQKARVELNAYNKRGKIYIEIKDDGRGINTEVVYKKALEKGVIDPNREYTEDEIKEFIMLPGFSTAEKVDNISGRGVGMDVVKTQISRLGGKVTIKSELNVGSTFTLEVPINHAIMNGMIVDIGGQHFILPTVNVKEILQPENSQWVYSNGERKMINVRDVIVPVIPPSILDSSKEGEDTYPLVALLEMDQDMGALPITSVIGRQELVVKPVGDEFSSLRYLQGMSILGNGRVSLILDVSYMFQLSNNTSNSLRGV